MGVDLTVSKHDVLVVGSGIAGLSVALENSAFDVAVLTKVYPHRSHSASAQGGISAALSISGPGIHIRILHRVSQLLGLPSCR